MDDGFSAQSNEMMRVIVEVTIDFYSSATPAGAAGRLARLHQGAWAEVIAGRQAGAAFAELRRHAARLFNADDLIEACNRSLLWALTPVVGAFVVCGPGEDRVDLREIGAALARLLADATAGAAPALEQGRRAA